MGQTTCSIERISSLKRKLHSGGRSNVLKMFK